MAENNVLILFEEIKSVLEGMKNKLEELPRVINVQRQTGDNKPDLSTVKEAVAETAKTRSEEIKGLLAKQWEAYAQLSTLTLQRLDNIRKSQEEQGEQQEQQ